MSRAWSLALLIALCALTEHPATQVQSPPTPARPFIELEKTRFASTEEVFFWVGVTAPDDYRIPQTLWNTCRLLVTRPDGTQRIDAAGWPIDGMLDRGWRGGRRLGSERLQVGRYVLVFEFAGLKTNSYSFTVEDVSILRDITAEFQFPSPLVLGSPDAVVALTVQNRSSQPIRFPHLGEMAADVSVGLEKTTGEKWSSSFFVPQDVLFKAAGLERSSLTEYTFSWKLASPASAVLLGPRDTYRIELPLHAVLEAHRTGQPIPTGEYDMRLSTVLQLLVGQRDGAWVDLSPIRMKITTVQHGTR